MVVVVVLYPAADQAEGGLGIPQGCDLHVITLKDFHGSFGHAVALRAAHGCEAGLQAELLYEDSSFFGDVRRAIVGQNLDDR